MLLGEGGDGALFEQVGGVHQHDVQKLTDRYVAEVDKMLAEKEKELLAI